jgi:hypothetical protein
MEPQVLLLLDVNCHDIMHLPRKIALTKVA